MALTPKFLTISALAAIVVAVIVMFIQNIRPETTSQTQTGTLPYATTTATSPISPAAFTSVTIPISVASGDNSISYSLPSAAYVFKNATFVKSLVSTDGTKRGDIYVSHVSATSSAVSSLFVVNKVSGSDEVIYSIQSNIFLNTAGIDNDSVGHDGLFGYSLGMIHNDSFAVDPLFDGGNYDAEGMRIKWYNDEHIFAVSPHTLSEMGGETLIKTFKFPPSTVIRLYAGSDNNGRITNFDFMLLQGAREIEIMSVGTGGVVRSSYAGSKHTTDKVIDMESHNVYAFSVVTSGSDSLVIRPLLKDGQPAMDDIMVKYDYANKSLIVQKS